MGGHVALRRYRNAKFEHEDPKGRDLEADKKILKQQVVRLRTGFIYSWTGQSCTKYITS